MTFEELKPGDRFTWPKRRQHLTGDNTTYIKTGDWTFRDAPDGPEHMIGIRDTEVTRA